MNQFYRLAVASVFAVALAGCAGLQLQEAEKMQPRGSAFDNALAKEYLAWSKSEYREGDYRDSDYAAVKSMTAADGGAVLPTEVGARAIPADQVGPMTDMYNRVTAALNAGGREKVPAEMACAQVRYDWLLQEVEENWPFQAKERAKLVDEFQDCMAKVEAALVGLPRRADSFLVFFDWNRDNLTPEAFEIVQTVAATAKAAPFEKVVAVGHTDTSGSTAYNMGLSQRRANSVKQALTGMGIAANKVQTVGRGEEDPLVPTGDGVREPQNRRVEISIDR